LSVRPEVQLGLWDRFVMTDAVAPYDQVLSRPAGTTMPAWTIPLGRDSLADMRYPAHDVLAIHTATQRFRERTDYVVQDGDVTFLAGHGPTPGGLFTIRYRHHPHWIVTDIPRTVVGFQQPPKQSGVPLDKFAELPQRATVLLDFLVRW
jgi:hypothetical protein